jgi:hypothetical protein
MVYCYIKKNAKIIKVRIERGGTIKNRRECEEGLFGL